MIFDKSRSFSFSIGIVFYWGHQFDTCLECHNNKVVAPTSCPCNNLAVICVTIMVNVRAGQRKLSQIGTTGTLLNPVLRYIKNRAYELQLQQRYMYNPQSNQCVVSVSVGRKQWAVVIILMPFLEETASLHKRVSSSPWTRWLFPETILEVAD